jgi:hypothetical protein
MVASLVERHTGISVLDHERAGKSQEQDRIPAESERAHSDQVALVPPVEDCQLEDDLFAGIVGGRVHDDDVVASVVHRSQPCESRVSTANSS